jgi:hypothetical protein
VHVDALFILQGIIYRLLDEVEAQHFGDVLHLWENGYT